MPVIEMARARAHDQGAPYFTSPSVWGASPDKPILFRVPVLGQRPLRMRADGLPDGVTLDEERGLLTGSAKEGSYSITLHAENALGSADTTLEMRIAPDGARRTPLLGFTTWNAFGRNITQDDVLDVARRMDELGLCDFGYQYVNIDSGWQGEYGGTLDAIQPNEHFPNMRALADDVHALGMKLGIYSTPMQKAWGGGEFPGCTKAPLDPAYANNYFGIGKNHKEEQNAAQWAEWTVDYLKYDWAPCDTKNASLMKEALLSQNRDIPMCVTVAAHKDEADWWSRHCCSWRDNIDSRGTWDNLRTRFDADDWAAYINPGHYFDHDMLEIGIIVWHENQLTEDEQIIAYTIRALFPSPIQISCDLKKLTAFDRALLMNEEVISVNQDALSKGAVCVSETRTRRADRSLERELKVYARQLENGDRALAFFNLGETDESVSWQVEADTVRDLWAKKDVAAPNGCLSFTLRPHTVRFFRV